MAEKRDDIEVVETAADNKVKWLFIIIGVLFVSVITLAVVIFMGGDAKQDSSAVAESAMAKPTPIYFTVEDPFIVNFAEQSNGKVKYMQVKMKVMARDQQVIDSFKLNLPAIQHELLMLFYSQKYDVLLNSEGTKALQQACLNTINGIIKTETSLENELEAVYFTSFIMQ